MYIQLWNSQHYRWRAPKEKAYCRQSWVSTACKYEYVSALMCKYMYKYMYMYMYDTVQRELQVIIFSSFCAHFLSLSLSLSLPPSQSRHGHSLLGAHVTHVTKDKPVSREDFVAMVSERLMAVQKDRDIMSKKAKEQYRQHGRSFQEIMVQCECVCVCV